MAFHFIQRKIQALWMPSRLWTFSSPLSLQSYLPLLPVLLPSFYLMWISVLTSGLVLKYLRYTLTWELFFYLSFFTFFNCLMTFQMYSFTWNCRCMARLEVLEKLTMMDSTFVDSNLSQSCLAASSCKQDRSFSVCHSPQPGWISHFLLALPPQTVDGGVLTVLLKF